MSDLKVVNNATQLDFNNQQTTGGTFTIGHTTLWLYQPYWPNYNNHYIYYPPVKSNWVTVNKAENGFIVEKDGKTFVATTPEEVTKLLTEGK